MIRFPVLRQFGLVSPQFPGKFLLRHAHDSGRRPVLPKVDNPVGLCDRLAALDVRPAALLLHIGEKDKRIVTPAPEEKWRWQRGIDPVSLVHDARIAPLRRSLAMRNALLRDWSRTPPHGPGGRAAWREFALQHPINIIEHLPRPRPAPRVISATNLMKHTSGYRSTGCTSVMAGIEMEERAAPVAYAVGKRLAPKRTFPANRECRLEGVAGRGDVRPVVIGDSAMKLPGAMRAWCRALERASLVAGGS